MRAQRWVYLLMIVLGMALGIAIAGVPSRHYDPPLHFVSTSTTTVVPSATVPPVSTR